MRRYLAELTGTAVLADGHSHLPTDTHPEGQHPVIYGICQVSRDWHPVR